MLQLTLLRQALLREAMQGQLLPQDPTDEPAAVLLQQLQAARAATGKKGRSQAGALFAEEAVEGPFGIPASWVWCRLGDISDNVEYGTSEKASLDSKGVPVLRMNNIQNGEVLVDNLKYLPKDAADLPKLFLQTNDLLFNRTNSAELVGKAGIYKGESNKMTFASYLIRVQFPVAATAYFANYYINSLLCRLTEIEPFVIQQNGQANFNGTKLKDIRIPLPPLAEHHRIVAKLEQLLGHCDALEQRIRTSRRLAEQLLATALREALRQTPTASVRLEIWTRAAGRCQLCNEWLLTSTKIGSYAYRRGEMAHIVGQSDDPRSPRTDSPLTSAQRESPDNFMLLCQADHDTIDHKLAVGHFTIDKLHEIKRKQEAHIQHVTGLPQNQTTCVVRLFGMIRNTTVQLSRQECNETTLRHASPRFAQFHLDHRNEGTEINLNHLSNPEDHSSPHIYWAAAQTAINKGVDRAHDAIQDGEVTHLSLFSFARIPALVYFGFKLGNKLRCTLFERHQVPENEWYWQPEVATLQFEHRCRQTGTGSTGVALIVNVSGTIPLTDLPMEVTPEFTVYELRPSGVAPV
nr:hypothetical protein [Tanacetum cinerariifolium]